MPLLKGDASESVIVIPRTEGGGNFTHPLMPSVFLTPLDALHNLDAT